MSETLYRTWQGEWRPRGYIKAKTMIEVCAPGIIDPRILQIVVALNALPFVIKTVESCSGHIRGSSAWPQCDGRTDDTVAPFLMIVYDKSRESSAFHRQLSKRFSGPHDHVEEFSLLKDRNLAAAARGDTSAFCINCGEVISAGCGCDLDYAEVLDDERRAARVQRTFRYWKFMGGGHPWHRKRDRRGYDAMQRWLTPVRLHEFWSDVAQLTITALESSYAT